MSSFHNGRPVGAGERVCARAAHVPQRERRRRRRRPRGMRCCWALLVAKSPAAMRLLLLVCFYCLVFGKTLVVL